MDNKLKPTEAQQIPPWVRHFLIHVVKRCASTVVTWCDQMQEAIKADGRPEIYQGEARQIEATGSGNGRASR